MNELQEIQNHNNLPANIEELARFVLVGREKLVSVKAEIRAIDKLNLAEEVRTQKRDEAIMLSEALLDAEARIGELTRALPKANKGNQYTGKMVACNVAPNQKPKLEVIKSLGFNEDQVKRFEMLANNPDVVAQVKAEARENDDLPTRSRVLQLVKEKNKPDKQSEVDRKEVNKMNSAIVNVSNISTHPQVLKEWFALIDDDEGIDFNLSMIDDGIQRLQIAKAFVTKNRGCRNAVN